MVSNIKKITVVMYHYVRDLKNSRFPEIKGLDSNLFKQQLEYLLKNYNIVGLDRLINSLNGIEDLPHHPVLLTFDDGYSDHYNTVFPILNNYGVQGTFFPAAKAIMENKVLDVNKIHFVLASVKNMSKLVEEIFEQMDIYRKEYALLSNDEYFSKLAKETRFDTKEVIFVKRLLQSELDETLRKKIVGFLFNKYIGVNEDVFSRELYMNIDQLKVMVKQGMSVGSHGLDHYWLNTLSKEQQEHDILGSLNFIKQAGVSLDNWAMCYPYGAYNDDTIAILNKYKCQVAFTTKVDVADINRDNRLALPRLDTNDVPKDVNTITNRWYYNE